MPHVAVQSDGLLPEWMMLELQGDLECPKGDMSGEVLGSLRVDGTKAKLSIGYHELEGEVVPLSKPYLIAKTKALTRDGMLVMPGIAVVRNKISFHSRPLPVVGGRK